jgi:hypothetical protein
MPIQTDNKLAMLSDEILKYVTGIGSKVTMYNEEGANEIDALKANRFIDKKNDYQIFLDSTTTPSTVRVYFGAKADVLDPKEGQINYESLINFLRERSRTAPFYDIIVRKYGKEIREKDFSRIPKIKKRDNEMAQMQESMVKPYGSAKKSTHVLQPAKIQITHTKEIDEEKVGSRSRNIQDIMIENTRGERFYMPVKNMTAARAMARHIGNEGSPYDAQGRHIISLAEDIKTLRTFARAMQNEGLNEHASLILTRVREQIETNKKQLTQIKSSRSYNSYFENWEQQEIKMVTEDQLDNLYSVFGLEEHVEGPWEIIAQLSEDILNGLDIEEDLVYTENYNIDNIRWNKDAEINENFDPTTQFIVYSSNITGDDDFRKSMLNLSENFETLNDDQKSRFIKIWKGVIEKMKPSLKGENMMEAASATYATDIEKLANIDFFQI